MPSWIFTVLGHWNNSPLIDMALHSDTLSWFQDHQYLLLLLGAACNKYQFYIFSLTRPGLEHMTYRAQGQHAYHIITDVVMTI
jgi:hypothetical protein